MTAADGRSRPMFASISLGLSYSARTRPHPLLEIVADTSFADCESLPNVMKVNTCMIVVYPFDPTRLNTRGNEPAHSPPLLEKVAAPYLWTSNSRYCAGALAYDCRLVGGHIDVERADREGVDIVFDFD